MRDTDTSVSREMFQKSSLLVKKPHYSADCWCPRAVLIWKVPHNDSRYDLESESDSDQDLYKE